MNNPKLISPGNLLYVHEITAANDYGQDIVIHQNLRSRVD